MVLSWKRIINDTSHYVATGKLIMVNDKRMSLLTSTTSSTLLITLVREEDAGQYVCEVSSSPPVHMAHWIKIKGKNTYSILSSNIHRFNAELEKLPVFQEIDLKNEFPHNLNIAFIT